MSTAVAAPPMTSTMSSVGHTSPRHLSTIASSARSPSNVEHHVRRSLGGDSPGGLDRMTTVSERPDSIAKASPPSLRAAPPPIKVKKEPGSPSLPSARPRPKRLDLSSSTAAARGPQTARGLSSRDSAGLVAIQDVGIACLSPGFQTNDPSMREQLQRSLDVRDQQRLIIEARQKGTRPGPSRESDGPKSQDTTLFGVQTRTPTTARRKGPPPGLSIHAPSASHFANDRVIQSAPMHQTFTGLRPGEHPFSRHVQHGASNLSQTSNVHHVPATQTNNRLPPISDVFPNDRLDQHRSYGARSPVLTHLPPPVPSPGFPPSQQTSRSTNDRSREFRSADEAMHSLSGGRDELMPKVVHYGGVQPPTPPSPLPTHHQQHHHTSAAPYAAPRYESDPARVESAHYSASTSNRRRTREEYERDNNSPPTTFQRAEAKRAALDPRSDDSYRDERDWRNNMSSAEKREEFLRLCERAWDLFHS